MPNRLRRVAFTAIALAVASHSLPAYGACSADAECKGDRICVAGECQDPNGPSERPHKVRKRFVRPGLFYGGIVVAALTPIALGVAFFSSVQKTGCENDARVRAFGTNAPADDSSCSSYNPAIITGFFAAGVFAIVGTTMIVLGAEREPVEPSPESRLKIIPWTQRDGGGMSLRLSF